MFQKCGFGFTPNGNNNANHEPDHNPNENPEQGLYTSALWAYD